VARRLAVCDDNPRNYWRETMTNEELERHITALIESFNDDLDALKDTFAIKLRLAATAGKQHGLAIGQEIVRGVFHDAGDR